MKRFQPLFQLLNLLVLDGTGRVGGANRGCFAAGNPNLNPQDRQCYLTNSATGNPESKLQSIGLVAIGLVAIGLVQLLNLSNEPRRLHPVVQMVGAADVAIAAGAAYLHARLEAGLSITALQFGNLPSIELSKPRLNGGGSRRLYVAST